MKKIMQTFVYAALSILLSVAALVTLPQAKAKAATSCHVGSYTGTQSDYVIYTNGTNARFAPGKFCLGVYSGGSLVTYATFQGDGNFVVYKSGHGAIWSSRTNSKGATALTIQTDGNVVIYRNSTPLWSTRTNGDKSTFSASGLFLTGNGNLMVKHYMKATNSWRVVWSSIV